MQFSAVRFHLGRQPASSASPLLSSPETLNVTHLHPHWVRLRLITSSSLAIAEQFIDSSSYTTLVVVVQNYLISIPVSDLEKSTNASIAKLWIITIIIRGWQLHFFHPFLPSWANIICKATEIALLLHSFNLFLHDTTNVWKELLPL